ncbi:hypothetical protein BTVI_124090 [Pitangus sulphuratus]|nr:hypothetical protein BTVI_124090 [Pitangus sulphuratus]
MKFNKWKCQILHLRQGNLRCTDSLGNEMLESSAMERDLGIVVNGKLNMSQQCLGSQEGQLCPGGHQAKHHQPRAGIVLLCSALGQPHLEYCVQFWVPQYKKDIQILESVQRRAIKMVKDLEGKPYEEQLRSHGLFNLEETEGRPHCSYNFLMRGRGWKDIDLFSVMMSDKTQGNGLTLCQGRFSLHIRKKFFTQRVFGHWNRFPREVVTAPSLKEF